MSQPKNKHKVIPLKLRNVAMMSILVTMMAIAMMKMMPAWVRPSSVNTISMSSLESLKMIIVEVVSLVRNMPGPGR